MLWRRVIKLRERFLCQAETSGHLITDKWGLVLASARINPFCKHSYPNLLNMSFRNFTKMQMWFPPRRLLREIDLGGRLGETCPEIYEGDRVKNKNRIGCHNLHLANCSPMPSVVRG